VTKATEPTEAERIEQFRAKLSEGRPIDLLRDDGLPVLPYKWRLGNAVLEKAAGVRGCRFDAIRDVMLDLTPPITHSSYTIDVELQFDYAGGGVPNAKELSASFAAAYLAGADRIGQDQSRLFPFYSLSYKDFDAGAAIGRAPQPALITAQLGLARQSPGAVEPRMSSGSIGELRFTPPDSLPGPWRAVRLEVSDAGVRFGWCGEPGGPVQWIPPVPVNHPDRLNEMLTPIVPQVGPLRLSVQGPYTFGIWCKRSGVSVRTCVITPRAE
jgi:hypothetical protein